MCKLLATFIINKICGKNENNKGNKRLGLATTDAQHKMLQMCIF